MRGIKEFIKSKGYDIGYRDEMMPYIESWKAWERGDTPFHRYVIYNGDRSINCRRKSLQMFKRVCEELAGFSINEDMIITVGDEAKETSTKVNNVLKDNDFKTLANEWLEKSNSLGTSALVLSMGNLIYDTNTKLVDFEQADIKIDLATAEMIIPLSFRGRSVTECAFVVHKAVNGKMVAIVSMHILENGKYVINNYMLERMKVNYKDITDQLEESAKRFETNSDKPLFCLLRPAIANVICDNSPYGVSVLSDAISVLEGLDITYDSFVNEFILGKKRIFVDDELLKVDTKSGDIKAVYDVNDIIYNSFPGMKDKEPIKESNMELRIDEHEKGIQLNLNLLSYKAGLGKGYFKFDNGVVSTATEVISNNSDLFRNVNKQSNAVVESLTQLIQGILVLLKKQDPKVNENEEITITIDDSVFIDTDKKKDMMQKEIAAGIAQPWEYRKEFYGESDEDAKKNVSKPEFNFDSLKE